MTVHCIRDHLQIFSEIIIESNVKVIVTGSSGLIGSEASVYFDSLGWEVIGIDNNMRADFFGADGDTRWNRERVQAATSSYTHAAIDIRDRQIILDHYKHQKIKSQTILSIRTLTN